MFKIIKEAGDERKDERKNIMKFHEELESAEDVIKALIDESIPPSKAVYKALALQQVSCEGACLLLGFENDELQKDCTEHTGNRYDRLFLKYNQLLSAKTTTQLLLGRKNPADVRFMFKRLQGDRDVT